MTLRVGIISAAWGATAHLPAWRMLPGVEVVAICTSRRETAEAAALEYKVDMPFWDAAVMAAHPDIDVIDVGTRPWLRQEMSAAALAAGKHVYHGMPFAGDIDAARRLRDAAQNSGTVAVVDAYAEHIGAFQLLEELITEGTLGTVQTVVARLELSIFAPAKSQFRYNWFHDAAQGSSAIRNLGGHLIHMLVRLLGPVEQVAGIPQRFVERWEFEDAPGGLDVDSHDTGVAALRFASGTIGTMTTAWAGAAAPGFHLELAGDRGRAVLTAPMMPDSNTTLQVGRRGGSLEAVVVPDRFHQVDGLQIPSTWPGDPRGAMLRSFSLMASAIRGETRAHPDFDVAHHVFSVTDAIATGGAGAGWERPDPMLGPVTDVD